MELTNSFVVDAPVSTTWAVLTDLARVAPCLPGAELTGSDGEDHHGRVTVKVGPVTARYEGTARFDECDDAAHRAVIRAQARESRGQGGVSATIAAQLTEHGEGTHVALSTDLALTGRVAQFGRGVITDVSGKIVGQFADRLEREITSPAVGAEPSEPGATPAATPTTPTAAPAAESALALGDLAGPVLRRAAPTVGAAALALLAGLALGRAGRRRAAPGALVVHFVLHPAPSTIGEEPR